MRRTGHEGPDYYGLVMVCGGERGKPVAAAERRPRAAGVNTRPDDGASGKMSVPTPRLELDFDNWSMSGLGAAGSATGGAEHVR